MALDARTRSSIYEKLIPVLGEHDANAFMSEFPSSEADELVTKQFLRAELVTEVGSLRTEMASLENRLTLRLGGAIAASTALLAAVVSLQ